MLCPHCRVHTSRSFPYCLRCGRALGDGHSEFSPAHLIQAGTTSGQPLSEVCTTIGRSPGNTINVADQYVSRYHARIWRAEGGYLLEDLDTLNGTFVNGERLPQGGAHVLNDYDVIGFGPTAQARFEQPRGAELGSKTLVGGGGSVMMAAGAEAEAEAEAATKDPLSFRPRRQSGWALKHTPSAQGRGRLVLRNERTGDHVEITERDEFLWQLMDGEHTVRDLMFAYSDRFGQLGLARIQQLIDQLRAADLVSEPIRAGPGGGKDRGLGSTILTTLTRMELSISGIDGILGRIYRAVGWPFFTRIGLAVLWLVVVAGFVALVVAFGRNNLLDLGDTGVVGGIAVMAGYLVGITVHELGHAIATKSYGRRVRRGGFLVMLGLPYAFVDTTEMWFEGKGPRIVVSLAGPVMTTVLAGIFAAGAAFLPTVGARGICFQIALGLYLNTLVNLNPLLTLDGYYALSDMVEKPRLREEAMHYFVHGLGGDLVHRRLGVSQLGLGLYGLAALLGTVGFLLFGVYSWNSTIGGFVHEHLPSPFDQLVLYAGLALILFPVWFGVLSTTARVIRRRLRPEQGTVDGPEPDVAPEPRPVPAPAADVAVDNTPGAGLPRGAGVTRGVPDVGSSAATVPRPVVAPKAAAPGRWILMVGAIAGILVLSVGAGAFLLQRPKPSSQPGGAAAVAPKPQKWEQWKMVPGILDVQPTSTSGQMLVTASGKLGLLQDTGQLSPFARGQNGYQGGGNEPYIAIASALQLPGCNFIRDDTYALRLSNPEGVTRIDSHGAVTQLVTLNLPGELAGIAFDTVGKFGNRLLVTSLSGDSSAVAAVDCKGQATTISTQGPRVEGGVVVAPNSFGTFGGNLIAPDEFDGKIFAFDETGKSQTVAESGLPGGQDMGVESAGFVPAGFVDGNGAVYIADRASPGNAHPGTDTVLRLTSSALKDAGVRDGDLLVVTEGGGRTIDVRCDPNCSVREVASGSDGAHIEGHLAFVGVH